MKRKHFILGTVFLISLFLIATAFNNKQNETKDIVTIRIQEGITKKDSKMMIIKSGVAEIIKIDGFNTKEDPAKNFKKISNLLNVYLNDGYEIISSTALSTQMILITDYILVKE